MAGRNDLRYDEDDYVPPGHFPLKTGSGRGKALVAVAIVGLVIGAFVVSHLMRSRVRARDEEIMRVHAEQNALIESRQTGLARKLLGTWSRASGLDQQKHYPFRFDFRNGSSTITFGDNSTIEVRFYVRHEDHELIVVQAEPIVQAPGGERDAFSKGTYRFTFRPDGSIVLNDTMGGLVYTREMASPARLGTPSR